MGGFFGTVSKAECVTDLFYGTDYNSHLGTKRAGMATYAEGEGFIRSIHNLESSYFRTKFESELPKFKGKAGIGVISDTDPQPMMINSHLGRFAIVTVAKINNMDELVQELLSNNMHFSEMSMGKTNPTELVALLIVQGKDFVDGIENVFNKKVAKSSDESSVNVTYIGEDQSLDNSLHFDVEVKQLAAPQINVGKFLYPDECDFKTGTYTFDISTDLSSYEFQYTVSRNDDNQHILEKLARLVNSSGAGIHADLAKNASNKIALRLTSSQTGLADGQSYLFEVTPSSDHASAKAMQTLGIDCVTQTASNSSFLLNGTEHASLSNTFTVNNAFELTLNKPSSQANPVQIGFKTTADSIVDNVQSLVNVYNNLIQLSYRYDSTQEADKLRRDFTQVVKPYYNEFESFGLKLSDDGAIKVDTHLLTDAVTSADAKECFATLNKFKNDLGTTAGTVSVDPLNYASKTMITYKKPGHKKFSCPYLTSVYSGMMLDRYC